MITTPLFFIVFFNPSKTSSGLCSCSKYERNTTAEKKSSSKFCRTSVAGAHTADPPFFSKLFFASLADSREISIPKGVNLSGRLSNLTPDPQPTSKIFPLEMYFSNKYNSLFLLIKDLIDLLIFFENFTFFSEEKFLSHANSSFILS